MTSGAAGATGTTGAKDTKERRPRRARLRRIALATAFAGYLVLVIHPQPLFAYTLQRGNIVLHAREPLPEGYADHVAFARPVDLARVRAELEAGTSAMDPGRSGRYDRYRLLVGHLLQQRHLSVDELLSRRLERAETERQLVADAAIGGILPAEDRTPR